MNDGQWGSWFRESSDKFLLAAMFFVSSGFALHILHHGGDQAQLQFTNGLTNTFQGAFITLVTGAVLRKHTATAETKDPQSGVTTGVTSVKEEEK